MIAKIKKKADYNYLQEEFARRTFDESGDYEVKPFKLDVREHLINGGNRGIFTALDGGSSDKLALVLEPVKHMFKVTKLKLKLLNLSMQINLEHLIV